jgi:hypothetical protein
MKKLFTKDFGTIILWAIGGFIVWMILQIGVWYFLRTTIHSTTSSWTVISALSQALTSATIAVGGFVAYRELAESEKSRHIDIADRLFDELNSQDNIAARKWVYMEMPSDPQQWLANSTDEGNQAIKRVLNSLDRVSFLTQEGWIPDDVIMPWMHPMIAKSWEKLEAYVKHERVRRQEPYFYLYAEKVAERCRQWRAKNGIEKSNWVDKAI